MMVTVDRQHGSWRAGGPSRPAAGRPVTGVSPGSLNSPAWRRIDGAANFRTAAHQQEASDSWSATFPEPARSPLSAWLAISSGIRRSCIFSAWSGRDGNRAAPRRGGRRRSRPDLDRAHDPAPPGSGWRLHDLPVPLPAGPAGPPEPARQPRRPARSPPAPARPVTLTCHPAAPLLGVLRPSARPRVRRSDRSAPPAPAPSVASHPPSAPRRAAPAPRPAPAPRSPARLPPAPAPGPGPGPGSRPGSGSSPGRLYR